MINIKGKYFTALFLLSAFLLLKVLNFHVFSHIEGYDVDIHCEYCDFISQSNQNNPLGNAPVETVVKPKVVMFFRTTEDCNYRAPFTKTLLPEYLYNKPPPSSL